MQILKETVNDMFNLPVYMPANFENLSIKLEKQLMVDISLRFQPRALSYAGLLMKFQPPNSQQMQYFLFQTEEELRAILGLLE